MNYNEDFILQYLNGELDETEKEAFEKALQQDESLRTEVEDAQDFLNNWNTFSEEAALKQKLQSIHKRYQENHQFIFIDSNQGKKHWTKRVLPTLAIAASVSIVTFLTTLYILHVQGMRWQEGSKQDYMELSKEVNQIYRDQEHLKRNVSQIENVIKKPSHYSGTAFPVAKNGYFITNYHLVKDARKISVWKNDSTSYSANMIFQDKVNDLVLLKVNDSSYAEADLPYQLKTDLADLGEYVYTLGFPKSDLVFGEGSISSLTGYKNDIKAYQISIPVNPGNSGGPLFNEKGEIVGIITGKNSKKEGTTFAIKSWYIQDMLRQVMENPVLSKPDIPRYSSLPRSKVEQVKNIKEHIYSVQVYR